MASQNFPGATSFNIGSTQSPPASNAVVAERFEDWLSATKRLVGAQPEQTFQITGGGAFPNGQTSIITVDTNGAASADLFIISPTNFHVGAMICIRNADTSRTVILKHMQGTGAPMFLHGAADLPLRNSSQRVFLQLNASKTTWTEVFRWYGTNTLDARGQLGLAAGAVWGECTTAEAQAGTNGTSIMTPRRVADALLSEPLMHARRSFRTPGSGDELTFAASSGLYKASIADIVNSVVSGLTSASFTKSYASGEQVVTNGAGGAMAHGLGGEPTYLQGFLRCKTAEAGYGAGVLIKMDNSFGFEKTRGIVLGASSTEVFYRCSDDSSSLIFPHKDTGSATVLTPANWRLIIRARR